MSEEAIKGLNTFVFYFAIPALLFRAMAGGLGSAGFSIVAAYFSAVLATFTMLNLFVAIIVNAMQSYSEAEHQA